MSATLERVSSGGIARSLIPFSKGDEVMERVGSTKRARKVVKHRGNSCWIDTGYMYDRRSGLDPQRGEGRVWRSITSPDYEHLSELRIDDVT